MQRWRHAGVGPRCALVAGILLGVASLALYQSAYAAEPPYPGPIALPSIPNGPTLGCNDAGTTNQTWVCGFNPLSTITFRVDGKAAGTAQAMSSGCVFVVVTFLPGEVEIDNNAPVKVNPGANYLTVEGVLTTNAGSGPVGLRLPFQTPRAGSNNECVITPPTTPVTPVPPHVSTTFPSLTTVHAFSPTTLAKVLETPLVISPNKVILESSLLAGVLAAALCAGALGAMWGGTERDRRPLAAPTAPVVTSEPPSEPAAPPDARPPTAQPTAPVPPPVVAHEPVEPPHDEPASPDPSEPEVTPSPPAPSSGSTRPIVPHAFVRQPIDPNRGVT